ncbi:MAG: DUF3365 domain-containing protein [Pseudobdellovibrionaceae bacterium]
MKPIFTSILFSALIFVSTPAHANDDATHKNQIEKAENLIKSFQISLKSELMKAIEEGGPEKAISVCNEKAPLIASGLSETDEISIGRTALGFRNPKNAPDDLENAILHDFIKQKKDGISVEKMVSYKEEDGLFRYMKAIPMQPMCAMCHGEKVDRDLYAKIKTLYPDDTAINYKLDDIRGAFTVKISTVGKIK